MQMLLDIEIEVTRTTMYSVGLSLFFCLFSSEMFVWFLLGKQFQAIFSEIIEKPAHEAYMFSDDEDDIEEEIRSMPKFKPERSQPTRKQPMESTVSELRKQFDIVHETEKS